MSGPVDICWSSVKICCLGTFQGLGDLFHDNWDPRIEALKNQEKMRRQRGRDDNLQLYLRGLAQLFLFDIVARCVVSYHR